MRIKKTNRKDASKELHDAFKTYAGINTLKDLDTRGMENYLGMIRMLMARERGVMIQEPNEMEEISDLSMKEFFKLKLHNHE